MILISLTRPKTATLLSIAHSEYIFVITVMNAGLLHRQAYETKWLHQKEYF